MNTKLIITVAVIVLIIGGFFIWQNSGNSDEEGSFFLFRDGDEPEIADQGSLEGDDAKAPDEDLVYSPKGSSLPKVDEPVSEVVNVPSSLKNNCIGFLTAVPQEIQTIPLVDAGWTRPHPGPFVWGYMEKSSGANYDFSIADGYVKAAQTFNVAILATIWPFADWDQQSNADCKVPDTDIFKPGPGGAGLPSYRCKPQNVQAYKNFLAAVVERYDGDGLNDMPKLKIPIKYWEILNEPEMYSRTLTFFKGNAGDYFEVLKNSYEVVKKVCPDCKVLHGGNAGSKTEFLNFWGSVFGLGGGKYFDIANTHFIGQGDFSTLNAKPFKNLLNQYGIKKAIWVTEAQYENSSADVKSSVSGALANGAEKVFFVSFQVGGIGPTPPGQFASVYKETVGLCP